MMNGAVPAALKMGGIYRMTFYPGDRITPKNPGDTSREKYFVIVGLSGDRVLAASLIINSQINARRFMRIGPYQHRILSSDYSFMTKTESYVNCFEIKELSAGRIIASATFVCDMNPEDLKDVIALAAESPFNRESVLLKYGLVAADPEP